MKTIQFHVGSGRCGSTLIQALFNDDGMHQIFANNSIKYEPDIYLATGELSPLKTYDEAEWTPVRDTHFRPLTDKPFDTFFITQENFFGVEFAEGSTNTTGISCDAIEYLTDGFDTKIVILVRRQDTYIESLYNMQIKRWETRDFPTFLAEMPLANFDWASIIDVYAERFGRENVTVLPFERAVLQTGGQPDFIAAMLATIGVKQKVNITNLPVVNPSLSPRVMEIQRLANQTLTDVEALNLANWFETHIPKDPGEKYTLMTDDQRRDVLDFFREPNERLGREYLKYFNTAYYVD